MNRLIIIGNGFDLAHGLPTSYKDFIDDYFIEKTNLFLNGIVDYEDKLITIKRKYPVRFNDFPIFKSCEEVKNFIRIHKDYFSLSYNSKFFENLTIKFDDLKWIDVESEYFDNIIKHKDKNGNFKFDSIKGLNEEFEYLRSLLELYLSKIDTKNIKLKNDYQHLFCDFIRKEDVVLKIIENDKKPDELLFLNFNYTNTLDEYYYSCNRRIVTKFNFIHGELNCAENPLIFGFGDEYDRNYKAFEDERNNILFEHIKSFGYFKTQNYHNLIRFIDSDEFQVFIFGHSCGLTDRTMLKEIFENEKCMSIKIFYHQRPDGSNDYIEKTMDISRHFENKGLMRKKIVPFPLSKKM